jgi:hypothetical protein
MRSLVDCGWMMYRDKSNSMFLVSYGFALQDNIHEKVLLYQCHHQGMCVIT